MHQVFEIPTLSYSPFMTLQLNYEAFIETSVVKRGPDFPRAHPKFWLWVGDGEKLQQILGIFWERDKFNFLEFNPPKP